MIRLFWREFARLRRSTGLAWTGTLRSASATGNEACQCGLIAPLWPLATVLPKAPRPAAHTDKRRRLTCREPEFVAPPSQSRRKLIVWHVLELRLSTQKDGLHARHQKGNGPQAGLG
jgi:hypothetical protein